MNLLKISVIVISFLASPIFTFAAYNDVTMTTDAVISVNGLSLSVSGSSAVVESITVNSTNFTVTLQTGSNFTVTSADKATFSVVAPQYVQIDRPCTTTSSLTLTGGDNVTVTINPLSDACDSTATSGSGSSSSSGGGGGTASSPGIVVTTSTQTTTPAEEITTVAEETTAVAQEAVATTVTASPQATVVVSPVFTKLIKKGSSNSDIKRLQQLLNSDPDTAVATSGVGSAGNETNYFGSLTQKAVQKFQAKYGIVSSGTPETTGYGLVGPATRAKLAEVFGSIGNTVSVPAADSTPAATVAQPSETAVSVSPVFTRGLARGSSNSDIKRLQQLLNSDPDTAVATSGVGSSGSETNYFGSLTEKAVQKFQLKHGVVSSSSDAGYGYVGPKTRAKLSEVFGQ